MNYQKASFGFTQMMTAGLTNATNVKIHIFLKKSWH